MNTQIISIVNQKGGVAKTSTSINLAACLSQHSKKVLLIDIDPQGNATTGIGVDKNEIRKSVHEFIVDDWNNTADYIIKSEWDFFLLPSNNDLVSTDYFIEKKEQGYFLLKNNLEKLNNFFDFIIIDCPPSLNSFTISALTASQHLIIPVQCEYYALEGIADLLKTLNKIKVSLNQNLNILGVLRTMYMKNTTLSKEVSDQLENFFHDQLFKTIIPRNVKVSEAPSHGRPVIYYDPSSLGAKAYQELTKELLQILSV